MKSTQGTVSSEISRIKKLQEEGGERKEVVLPTSGARAAWWDLWLPAEKTGPLWEHLKQREGRGDILVLCTTPMPSTPLHGFPQAEPEPVGKEVWEMQFEEEGACNIQSQKERGREL